MVSADSRIQAPVLAEPGFGIYVPLMFSFTLIKHLSRFVWRKFNKIMCDPHNTFSVLSDLTTATI